MMVSQIYTHLKTPDVHTLNKYSSSYTVPHSRTIHTLITVYSHPHHMFSLLCRDVCWSRTAATLLISKGGDAAVSYAATWVMSPENLISPWLSNARLEKVFLKYTSATYQYFLTTLKAWPDYYQTSNATSWFYPRDMNTSTTKGLTHKCSLKPYS